jgi:hypothetical protein
MPTPAPTPAPSAAPTSAPSLAPLQQPAGAGAVGTLPFLGAPPADGSAQAVAIAPTPQSANAVDTGAPNDTFLVFTVVIMAIPILLTMTLLATVLTRR